MSSSSSEKAQAINEVNLLDLAVTLVRYKHVFIAMFVIILGSSIGWAFISKDAYQYTTLVQLAGAESDKPLVQPKAVIARLLSRRLPELEQAFREKHNQKIPFQIQFDIPEGTSMIRIVSKATLDDASWVEDIHKQILADLMARQTAMERSYSERITGQIENANSRIEKLQDVNEPGQAISTLLNRVADLEDQLTKLVNAEVLAVSNRSAEKSSHGKAFIMLAGVILAGLLSIVSTFAWAAIQLVRSRV